MKLSTKKTIFVGFAFFLICMFWQVYDTVIAKMLINTFGLNQTWSGLVMAIDNIVAIVLLPVFGILSDKTNTKKGRRTPYITFGTIVAAVLIVFVALFDHLQLKKLYEANIGPVVTWNVEEEGELSYTLKEGENTVIVLKAEVEEVDKVEGKKVYSFTDPDTALNKYYAVKEDAANYRGTFLGELRNTNIWIFIGFMLILCVVLVAMATFRTPAVSLMPDVTPKPLRSKANAIINLMGSAGGIVALGFMTFLSKDYKSYIGCFACLAALMIVSLVIFLISVNEPKLVLEKVALEEEYGIKDIADEEEISEEEKAHDMPKDVRISFFFILASIVFWFMAYNAATSKFSVYAGTILGTGYSLPLLVAQGAAIVSYIPIGIISSHIGRKKTILIGVGILFAAFLLGSFLTSSTAILVYVTMALAGIGWATINVNSYPMVVEMSKGSNVGKYTGFYYTASMAAQIATPVLSGLFMDLFGTMRVLFPYCVLFCVFAFITMLFVKHGDSKPIPEKKLEAYDAMDVD